MPVENALHFTSLLCISALFLCDTWINTVSSQQVRPILPPPGNNLKPPLNSGGEGNNDYDYNEDYDDYVDDNLEKFNHNDDNNDDDDEDFIDTEGSAEETLQKKTPVIVDAILEEDRRQNTSHKPTGPGGKNSCSKVRATLESRHVTDAYMPKCLGDGEYAPVQCPASNLCYCVNLVGQEVPGTRVQLITGGRVSPDSVDCSKVDRSKPIIQLPEPAKEQRESDWSGKPHHNNQSKTSKAPVMDFSPEPDVIGGVISSSEQAASSLDEESHNTSLWLRVVSDKRRLALIAAVTLGALVCLVALTAFLVVRLRKKDEGSYRLDEPKSVTGGVSASKKSASYLTPLNQQKEFFA